MKNIRNIFIISIAVLGGWLLGTHAAHAQDALVNILGYENLSIFLAEILANIINLIQSGVAWILALSGFLLNYSINLTLQMKSFLVQTPAVFTTWKALRDISGLFIIFTLLYAALKLILGLQDAKFGTLIKNIVVAGVVINFSFFFAGLGIDVSNIVSIQLYNAIAPANTLNAGNLNPSGLTNHTITDGGLSDVFMKSLKVPALYNPDGGYTAAAKTAAAGGAIMAPIKIILIGIASIMIMITTALSFAAAALAFVVRFVVLIFLLAFSPIWFASHIVPEIGEYAKKWTNLYKGMLVFMPVYLLLMYLALNILTTTPLLNGVDVTTAAGAAAAATNWYSGIITLVINAVIVIILLNFPLVAAVSVSAGMLKFINADKIGAGGVWKFARNNTVGAASSRIIGGFASNLDKKIGGSRLGNTLIARDFRAATTGALAKNKFGTSRSFEDLKKANKEVKAKDREMVRINSLDKLIAEKAPLVDIAKAVKEMNDKERLSLGADRLKNKDIAAHLKQSDFEAIKKSDDFSDEDKKAIADARTVAIKDAVARGDNTTIKHMVENMDGKDLLKLAGDKDNVVISDELVPHLKQSQLKTMDDEGLSSDVKKEIGKKIIAATPPHKSYGFIKKNKDSWGVADVLEESGGKGGVAGSNIITQSNNPNPPKFSKKYG